MFTDRMAPCLHLDEGKNLCEATGGEPGGCLRCDQYTPGLNEQERTRCEVWTRVMGYHRPVSQFNTGKQQEHKDRRYFVERPGDLTTGVKKCG